MKNFWFVLFLVVGCSSGSEVLDVDKLLGAEGLFKGLKVEIPAFGRSASGDATVQFEKALEGPGILDTAYGNFVTNFKKSPEEKGEGSKKNFKDAALKIFKHNVMTKSGESSFTMGINQFSDLTFHQFVGQYTGVLEPNTTTPDLFDQGTPPITLVGREGRSIPAYKNYFEEGHVTPIKSQRKCNACVPFAILAALESSMSLLKKIPNLDLSEQEIVDCPTGRDVARCSGNWPTDLLNYIKKNGVTTETDYPYEIQEGTCRAAGKPKVAKVAQYFRLKKDGDEGLLKEWVFKYGPMSTMISINDAFRFYREGIWDEPCEDKSFVHNVLVYGYGTSDSGQDYWLVKNSWDTNWGENGFMKMARNKGNLCRIADWALLIQA